MFKKTELPFVTTVRMPEAFREIVHARATANRRSLNSEIVCLLEDALAQKNGAAEGATSPRHEHAETLEGNSNDYANK